MSANAPGMQVSFLADFDAPGLLNLLADGVYLTDTDRRVVFWNRAAERITGWGAAEVVGRCCRENLLMHVDRDGHALCGHEHCPLHRSIVTGLPSSEPMLVFAQNKQGDRLPVEVTVSPVRNRAGEIVGGIEVFRDLTEGMQDQLRARKVQEVAMGCALPKDARVGIQICCEPRDIVGGDFYRIEQLSADVYAVLVADAMGHGVAAALYTVLLRSLWDDHRADLGSPECFMGILNQRLHALVQGQGYFGTAVCVVYDAATGELRCVRAGHPAPLLFRAAGGIEALGRANPALGLFPESRHQTTCAQLNPGDVLLLFTDGATEIFNAQEQELGTEGLKQLIGEQWASGSGSGPDLEQVEERLLRFSNQIHLPDDLTLVRLCRTV